MKIGLIDVDSHHFPNLPLMKLSAWHKSQGDTVEWYDALNAQVNPYERAYMSKVFTDSPDYAYHIYAEEVVQGGTGYDLKTVLPPEVEATYPDYSLYNNTGMAYGFLTRGCPRGCAFCCVGEKEGCVSRKVADLDTFWRGQREIKLCDPNLLACSNRIDLLMQLIDSGAWVDFTQGLDIRLMAGELADMIMRCRVKMIHFAWDNEADSEIVCRKLREFKRQTGIDERKARVYILTNYDTPFSFDLHRIYETRKMGFTPYVMIFNKDTAGQRYKDLQRWVNGIRIFRSCERFEDYRPTTA